MRKQISPDRLVLRHTAVPRLLGDEPAQRLLRAASAQDLRMELRKAGADTAPLGGVFPLKRKHAYILIVTIGGGEFYGANENADWHPEKTGVRWVFPEPCDPDRPEMILGEGLDTCHSSFREYGGVYRNHKTLAEHGVQPSGGIVWERWNPDMHRGEIVAELPEDGWEKELGMYDRGIPLMWSQGCGTPVDFCSRCGFVYGPKTKSRCSHILLRKLCFEEDGLQNMCLCPAAIFHDISYVGNNPAEKIAAALLRVASAEPPAVHSVKESLRLSRVFHTAAAGLVSELVKVENNLTPDEVEGVREACAPDPGRDAEFVKILRGADPSDVLPTLCRLEIILTPTQFMRIFSPSEPTGVSGFLQALSGIFGRLAREDPGFTDDAGYIPAAPPEPSLLGKLEPFVQDFGMKPVMRKRVLIIRRAFPERIRPEVRPTAEDRILATEYAKYLYTGLAMMGPSAAERYVGITAAGL